MFIVFLRFLNLKQVAWFTFGVCDYRGFKIGSIVEKYNYVFFLVYDIRGGSRTAATSNMERFVIITKPSILDVAAALDLPLGIAQRNM